MDNKKRNELLIRSLLALKFHGSKSEAQLNALAHEWALSLNAFEAACAEYFEFIDRLDSFDDDLDLFKALDRILAQLAYRVRKQEQVEDELLASLHPKYGYSDLEGGEVATSQEEDWDEAPDLERSSAKWAETEKRVRGQVARAISHFEVQDQYFFISFPGEPEAQKRSLSEDLAEIFADLEVITGQISECVRQANPRILLGFLGDVESRFSVHTMTHLLPVQTMARWGAGMVSL